MAVAGRQKLDEQISMAAQSMTRGACPSLAAPMITGDGLLVRLRLATPALSVAQYRLLAHAAQKHGNGVIEITARGNLQLRGITPESLAPLAADIDAANIPVESGVAIETPPLSGLDPSESAEIVTIASRLRERVRALDPQPTLAPKFAIVIDALHGPGLDLLTADIRLTPRLNEQNALLWTVAVAGTLETAGPVAELQTDAAIDAVVELIRTISSIGPNARARDLDFDPLDARLHWEPDERLRSINRHVSAIGVFPLAEGMNALGLRMTFGQTQAADLIAFLDVAERCYTSEIRLAPDHTLMLLGLAADAIAPLKSAAEDHGFRIDGTAPENNIAACAGEGACASAFYKTKSLAGDLVQLAPDLLDGSMTVHLSGCRKGCSSPGKTGITVVGAPMGYGIVVNGSASSEPVAYTGQDDLKSALARLSRLIRNEKDAGESAKACLTRLGAEAIATALRQG